MGDLGCGVGWPIPMTLSVACDEVLWECTTAGREIVVEGEGESGVPGELMGLTGLTGLIGLTEI